MIFEKTEYNVAITYDAYMINRWIPPHSSYKFRILAPSDIMIRAYDNYGLSYVNEIQTIAEDVVLHFNSEENKAKFIMEYC